MSEKLGLSLLENLATGIKKEDPAIKAILSDENGEGATANELEAVFKFINYYTRTTDIKNHKDTSLETLAQLFTKLRRRIHESDSTLLRRLCALTYRRGDTVWGNALNLKHIFEDYFYGIICYIAENTNKENLLLNGDFEYEGAWNLDGCVYDYQARFSGLHGLLFDGTPGSCEQTVEQVFDAIHYTFHFMLYGKCGVIIQREDGKYWNANDQVFSGETVLEWVDEEYINIFDKPDGWDNASCVIILPEDAHALTIKFVSIDGETAWIDYARLHVKPKNPSYTLILQYMGYTITDKTLHLGVNGDDPIPAVNYDLESYFDSAFVIGPDGSSQSQIFDMLLRMVKPCGIQVFTEFVGKKEKET
jgi:hypothetical protein